MSPSRKKANWHQVHGEERTVATVLRTDDRTPWEEGEADLQSSECSQEEDRSEAQDL